MKKSLILAGLLLTSSAVMAAGTEFFVGIDASKSSMDVKETYTVTSGSVTYGGVTYGVGNGTTYEGDGSDTAPSIKFGLIIDDTHKTYIKYGSWKDKWTKVTNTTLNYDYLIKLSSSKIVPFVGANVGYTKVEVEAEKATGSTYGIQTGILYPITDKLDFEFTLAYSGYNVDKTYTSPTLNGTYTDGITFNNFVGSAKFEAESSTNIGVGITYKF